jgi:hypothetical protein
VFQRLRENKLYTKLEKCEFRVTKADFPGHRITKEGLKMDDHKVKAILDWEPPKSILALRSVLGLASYQELCEDSCTIDKPLEEVRCHL